MNKRRYSTCWKCECAIDKKEDCNYMNSRYGKFNYCPKCFEEFINHNKDFVRPELSKQKELRRSLYRAMNSFHEEMFKSGFPIFAASDTPTLLIHNKEYFGDCDVCKEIIEVRCNDYCSKTIE